MIIFDEQLTDYIHVHPESPDSTTFYAHFPKKGCIKFGQNLNLMMKCIDTYNIKVA